MSNINIVYDGVDWMIVVAFCCCVGLEIRNLNGIGL